MHNNKIINKYLKPIKPNSYKLINMLKTCDCRKKNKDNCLLKDIV